MFLITPRPQPEESLSSWRQRFGMENGFRLFPLAPGELRRSDPDVAPSDATLKWISRTHGVPIEKLVQMTAAGKFGTTHGKAARGLRRWIVSMQYSRMANRRFGLPYCPVCLQEDAIPYFRLHWRSCLHSHCPHHGVLYRDVCFRCNTATWPGPCANSSVYEKSWSAPHICCVCGADLRDATSGEKVVATQSLTTTPATDAMIPLSAELTVSAESYGDAVWIVCQLFMRGRSARCIAQRHVNLAPLVSELQSQSARSVEELPIHLRHMLTTEVHSLFVQWPLSLVDFCAVARISAEHLSQNRVGCPAWFESFVRQYLCIQKRGISVDHVVTACASLSNSGMPVSKASVSRMLGGSCSNAIDKVLGQRVHATHIELTQFLSELSSWTEVCQIRRSSTEIRLRDSLILLLSILERVPPVDVAEWRKSKCLAVVDAAKALDDSHNVVAVRCVTLIDQLLMRYERFRGVLRPCSSDEIESAFFGGFRGASVPQRSLQRTLSTAMNSLDPRLVRSVSVFNILLPGETNRLSEFES